MKITIYRYPHPFEPGKWLYTGQTNNLIRRHKRHCSGIEQGFGRRFKKMFPSLELPKPDAYDIEVADNLEANWEETVAIFRNHTWRGQGGMNVTLPSSDDYKILGKLGGPIAGRKNAESGQMRRIHDLPQSKAAYVENGKKWGKINGPLQKEHLVPFNSDKKHQQKAGRKGGAWAVQNQVGIHAFTKKQRQEASRKSGIIAAETGQIDKARNSPQAIEARLKAATTPENKERMRQMAVYASHCSWHVRRGIVKPDCKFCQQ